VKNSKDKIVFVLMGLVIGFALGISILFWRQSIDITQRVYEKSKQYIISLFKAEEHEETSKNIIINKKPPKKKKKGKDEIPADSINSDSLDALIMAESFSPDDTVWYDEYSDVYSLINADDDEVARDKLIMKKQIEALSVNASTEKTNTNIDSLLIGGKSTKEEKNKYTVEFWESPLNYKGYKKTKNVVVLFGIKQLDEVELKLINNDLFLCLYDNFYALENTSEFKNLIPLNNQHIINQLKGK